MKYPKQQKGFTLMEIVVATTIFAIVVTSLLSLFNYTLKINRKSEALRQAAQGMRNFVEFLVKEVRNGQIDYDVSNSIYTDGVGPCVPPGAAHSNVNISSSPSTYHDQENLLGIINTDNVQECFYFGKADGSYVDSIGGPAVTFDAPANSNYTLVMEKAGIANKQILNPSNFRIDKLMFLVRPTCDPFSPGCADYGNSLPKIQPFVTILMKFTAQLPTGEVVPVYYQTSVSSQKYDIPN